MLSAASAPVLPWCTISLVPIPGRCFVKSPSRLLFEIQYHSELADGSEATRPITLWIKGFREQVQNGNFMLLRRLDSGIFQEVSLKQQPMTVSYAENGEELEIISPDNGFTTLQPAGKLVEQCEIPLDLFEIEVGQSYVFVFRGATIRWWAWGNIPLAGRNGKKIERSPQTSKRGWPDLFLSASKAMEFTVEPEENRPDGEMRRPPDFVLASARK